MYFFIDKNSDYLVYQYILAFAERGMNYKVISLTYDPKLSSKFHKLGLSHVNHINIFDYIQGFKNRPLKNIFIEDLNIFKNAEYLVVNNNVLLCEDSNVQYEIALRDDRSIKEITVYNDNQKKYTYIIDDKAYVSMRLVYNGNVFDREEYLNADGQVCLIKHLPDGQITNVCCNVLRKKEYKSFNDIALELLDKKSDKPTLFSSCDQLDLLGHVFSNKKLVSSLNQIDNTKLEHIITAAPFLNMQCPNIPCLKNIEPPASSQRCSKQKIYIPCTGLSFAQLNALLSAMDSCVKKVEDIDFVLGAKAEFKPVLYYRVKSYESKNLLLEDESIQFNNELGLRKEDMHFNVHIIDEENLSEAFLNLNESRLVIDIRDNFDMHLHIISLELGIPQINITDTGYLGNNNCGLVIPDLDKLEDAILHYTENLQNWNDCFINCRNLCEKYNYAFAVKKLSDVFEQ